MHTRHLLVSLAAVVALSACGTTPTPTPTATPTPAPTTTVAPTTAAPTPPVAPASDLTGITVSDGDNPQITLAKTPWAIDKTTTKVIKEGTSSQVVAAKGVVGIFYRGVNATTGKEFDKNYGATPLAMPVEQFVPGFTKGLVGQKVGSRVLIAIPSQDGYPQGQGEIKPGDTILFVVDIVSAEYSEPTGHTNPAPDNAPKVTMGADGPTISTSGLTKPTKLGVYDLIAGEGPAIKETSQFLARFRSFTWDGKVFEDAWRQTQGGVLNGTIPGWEQGLLGKKAGSRVMLVIPPELAYPGGRNKAPTLKPGETLIYIVDITYVA